MWPYTVTLSLFTQFNCFSPFTHTHTGQGGFLVPVDDGGGVTTVGLVQSWSVCVYTRLSIYHTTDVCVCIFISYDCIAKQDTPHKFTLL